MADQHLVDRIKTTLNDGIPDQQDGLRVEKLGSPFFRREEESRGDRKSVTKIVLKEQRAAELQKICYRLFDATHSIDGHFERLDQIFAELLTFNVCLRDEQTVQHVAETAKKFLYRLPSRPLGLPNIQKLPDAYFQDGPFAKDENPITWPCLKVTSNYSTNVLKVVLFRVIYGTAGTNGAEEKNLVDLTADLLDTCCNLESKHQPMNEKKQDRWLVVRTFLWASWQRFQMLYFFRTLFYSRAHGEDTELGSLTVLRSTLVAPGMTIQRFSDEIAFEGKPSYMCSWAFNLLRTDGIAIGSDFRHFHNRYNQLNGHLNGRCYTNEARSCDGQQMGDCGRHSLDPEDQSMHDEACPGDCERMYWDETSYRSIDGGRVIDFGATDYGNNLLRYKRLSETTLAISHAWAHGQGGRPDTGLNLCLHMRYAQLAESLGCDSYFLDTVCIPEDHQLRAEAIRHINKTFSQSKVTLIVEKDLLKVNVSNKYVELMECILATILVSDWNVRGWTLLEAMKGRRNVHLLCRSAETINYSEMIEKLVSRGRLDIAIFALLAPHLLSWASESAEEDRIGLSNPRIEEAGTLLSYRPASRLGDDIVIWSLMVNRVDQVAEDAKDLWRSQIGKVVKTGFLVSSAERLDTEGMSWAPATPYAAPKDHSIPSEQSNGSRSVKRFYRAFSGEKTEDAEIHEDGIFAKWYVHEFDASLPRCAWTTFSGQFRERLDGYTDSKFETQKQLAEISLEFLKGYGCGALLQPKVAGKPKIWSLHKHVAKYSGGVGGTLLVVLGARTSVLTQIRHQNKHQGQKWVWRGVWEWPSHIPLPKFEEGELWIA